MTTAAFINNSASQANADIGACPRWVVFDVDCGDEDQNNASAFQLMELEEGVVVLDAELHCIQAPGAGTGSAALVRSPYATAPADPAFHASSNVAIIANAGAGTLDAVGDTQATIAAATYDDYPSTGRALLGLDITEDTAISGAAWEVRVRVLLMRFDR